MTSALLDMFPSIEPDLDLLNKFLSNRSNVASMLSTSKNGTETIIAAIPIFLGLLEAPSLSLTTGQVKMKQIIQDIKIGPNTGTYDSQATPLKTLSAPTMALTIPSDKITPKYAKMNELDNAM